MNKVKKCNFRSKSLPVGYVKLSDDDGSSHGKVKKGYVPVVVGKEDEVAGERFLIPTQLIGHPSIVALLKLSKEEFGYQQEGVIRIPCHPDSFRDIIKRLPFKTF